MNCERQSLRRVLYFRQKDEGDAMTNNVEFGIVAGMFLLAIAGFGLALWSGDWRFLLGAVPLAIFLRT